MTMAGESSGKASGKRKRKVGLLYDERMCKHDTPDGDDHPECPNRIKVIWEKLQLTGLAQRCVVLGGSKAEDKHLQLVHTEEHVNLVKRLSTKKKDSNRNKNGFSSEAAYLVAGSVIEPDLGIRKILIVDWDVHHGNGTQKMFWKDPRVLVFSVHRHDGGSFYPTGDDGDYDKVGEGPGEGFNINVPWDLEQGRCGDIDYVAVWYHILIPVSEEFNPDIVLLSAGFDAAIGDPLGVVVLHHMDIQLC